MSMQALRWFFLGVVALMIGAAVFLQRDTTANLRAEIAQLKEEQRELVQLRAEHARLVAAQPAAAELQRLRADRAALDGLRAEIQKMKQRVEDATQRERAPTPRPAAGKTTLPIAFGADGRMMIEDVAVDLNWLRQRLAKLGPDTQVDLRITVDQRANAENVMSTVEAIQGLAKELAIKINVALYQQGSTAQ